MSSSSASPAVSTPALKASLADIQGKYVGKLEAAQKLIAELDRLHTEHLATATIIKLRDPTFSEGSWTAQNVTLWIFRAALPLAQHGQYEPVLAGTERFAAMTTEQVAETVAAENDALVPVQVMAEALLATGRYKSESSAYGAAYSYLVRHVEKFERSGRGKFRRLRVSKPA